LDVTARELQEVGGKKKKKLHDKLICRTHSTNREDEKYTQNFSRETLGKRMKWNEMTQGSAVSSCEHSNQSNFRFHNRVSYNQLLDV
jgi:hypothetical protein